MQVCFITLAHFGIFLGGLAAILTIHSISEGGGFCGTSISNLCDGVLLLLSAAHLLMLDVLFTV